MICYTRSSQLIRRLPSEFPSNNVAEEALSQSFLQANIYDTDKLVIYKVSTQSSQGKIEIVLENFIASAKVVLIFIANSAELKKTMINHLRIIVENFEARSQRYSKMFVILLHFPAVDFFNHYYPSLYLEGWGHHYLDSVTPGTLDPNSTEDIKALVDIQEWYTSCCTQPETPVHIDDELAEDNPLESLIEESIPIIASRARCSEEDLTKFVTEKGFGPVLVKKYLKYWNVQAKLRELRRLTERTCMLKSTLNITDSVQINVRSYCLNFVVYVINAIGDDLKTIIATSDHEAVDLCHKLLELLPAPRLSQLRDFNVVNHRLHLKKPTSNVPENLLKFPLSKHISKYVEDVIDECRENINKQRSLSSNTSKPQQSLFVGLLSEKEVSDLNKLYCDAVLEKIESDPHLVSSKLIALVLCQCHF